MAISGPGDGDTKGEHILDARNLLCPLPVLRARKRLAQMSRGAILRVIATDPAAEIDMPHFCSEHGHRLLSTERRGAEILFRIRRA
jgi:tRNA 2-thiouridine synthesizing protein A